MTLSITLYGIPNCDTVKKARTWLAEHQLDYAFHDFKKQGLDAATIQQWLTQLSLEQLINRKGTTWRALTDEQKAAAEQIDSAIDLMIEKPSVIKRPVLVQTGGAGTARMSVGFSPAQFETLFSE